MVHFCDGALSLFREVHHHRSASCCAPCDGALSFFEFCIVWKVHHARKVQHGVLDVALCEKCTMQPKCTMVYLWCTFLALMLQSGSELHFGKVAEELLFCSKQYSGQAQFATTLDRDFRYCSQTCSMTAQNFDG